MTANGRPRSAIDTCVTPHRSSLSLPLGIATARARSYSVTRIDQPSRRAAHHRCPRQNLHDRCAAGICWSRVSVAHALAAARLGRPRSGIRGLHLPLLSQVAPPGAGVRGAFDAHHEASQRGTGYGRVVAGWPPLQARVLHVVGLAGRRISAPFRPRGGPPGCGRGVRARREAQGIFVYYKVLGRDLPLTWKDAIARQGRSDARAVPSSRS